MGDKESTNARPAYVIKKGEKGDDDGKEDKPKLEKGGNHTDRGGK